MFEGSMLERVARSYHAVQEKTADEYGALSKYSAAVSQIECLEKEAEGGAGNGITFDLDPMSKVLMSYLLLMLNFIQVSCTKWLLQTRFEIRALTGSF